MTFTEKLQRLLEAEQPSKDECASAVKAVTEYRKRFSLKRCGRAVKITKEGMCVLCGADAQYRPAPTHKTYGDAWLERYFSGFETPAVTTSSGRNLEINGKPASMVLRYACTACCDKFAIAEKIHREGINDERQAQRAARLARMRKVFEDKSAKFIDRWDALWVVCDDGTFCEELKALAYKDFLKTTYWQLVRARKIWRANCKCQMCSTENKSLDVHHATYEHHGYEHFYLGDLVVLCRDCHAKFHDKTAA